MPSQATAANFAYIGTYTQLRGQNRAEGIYGFRIDPSSGALTLAHATSGIVNPSFLTLDPRQRYLYAVNELSEIDGPNGGAINAYAIDRATGGLTFLNRQPTHGSLTCHLEVDHTGKYLLVANYGSGSVVMFPILDDGRLAPASDFVQHVGSSVNPERQEGPHAHSINIDAGNRFALTPDLGMDKVVIYRIDLAAGKLVPNDPPFATVAPGSGPRHLAYHPNRRLVFVINEIGSTMTSFQWNESRGSLEEVQTISTLPEGFTGRSSCADCHVSPSGKFLYGSNRGHNSIVIYAIDEATGRLTLVGHESTRGRIPRNFGIDPTGTYLYAENQDSDNIVTFRVDQQTGKLTATGQVTEVPAPVCMKFARLS